ncbi:MAG TPA: phosphatase PAP2 family protein [Candidatus Limnocylindrales bacterium]|nr:phosphatase PAP2 family protein [Candidatus Limnocylindrales bacterium]
MTEELVGRAADGAVGKAGAATGATARSAGGDVIVDGAALGRRNDRILLAAVGAYVVLLSGLMLARGVSITPDVLLVALGLAAVLLGRGRLFLRDWVPFIGLFFAYELMRGYADDLGAAVHVTDVIEAERALFFGRIPTAVLQELLHPPGGTDPWAIAATVFYFLHFPLPIAVAFFLWLRRRRVFYDYVAALIVLSIAAFATYLVFPVAPPWWAAERGYLSGIEYLKPEGFAGLASLAGFRQADYLFTYTFYEINPNEVAAFPSLHAAYPFLAFLFARREFGRAGWLMLAYSGAVFASIVYLADHYVVDILAGIAYALAAAWLVGHGPAVFRRLIERLADPGLDAPEARAGRSLRGRPVRAGQVLGGLVVAALGAGAAVAMNVTGLAGGSGSLVYLVPWAGIIAGLSWAAAGLIER